jgi:hypothetical protein
MLEALDLSSIQKHTYKNILTTTKKRKEKRNDVFIWGANGWTLKTLT